jgi:hypothetical protein
MFPLNRFLALFLASAVLRPTLMLGLAIAIELVILLGQRLPRRRNIRHRIGLRILLTPRTHATITTTLISETRSFGPPIPTPIPLSKNPPCAVPLIEVKLMSVKTLGLTISIIFMAMRVNGTHRKMSIGITNCLAPHNASPIGIMTALTSSKTRRLGRVTTCTLTSSMVTTECLELLGQP